MDESEMWKTVYLQVSGRLGKVKKAEVQGGPASIGRLGKVKEAEVRGSKVQGGPASYMTVGQGQRGRGARG